MHVLQRRLDDVLKEKGRSRYWLAKRTGISEQNLGRLARCETTGIEFETLEKICTELNCQPGDLLVLVRNNQSGSKKRI